MDRNTNLNRFNTFKIEQVLQLAFKDVFSIYKLKKIMCLQVSVNIYLTLNFQPLKQLSGDPQTQQGLHNEIKFCSAPIGKFTRWSSGVVCVRRKSKYASDRNRRASISVSVSALIFRVRHGLAVSHINIQKRNTKCTFKVEKLPKDVKSLK